MLTLREFFVSPFAEFYQYRELIFYQIKAQFKQKHFQKALGPLWWVGEPLALAIMYIFITTLLFKQTFQEHHQIAIITSVLVWQWFARSVNGAPNLLLGFKNELMRTNLPILPLVFTNILVQLMIFGFSLIVIFVGMIISGVHLTLNVLYLPVLVILQLTMITAFVTHLSKTGVFFRDLSQVIWVFVSISFFISPIIYPRIIVPEQYRFWYDLNPFAILFTSWRDVLIYGQPPDLIGLGIIFLIFMPIALWGLRSVAKSRAAYYKRL